MFAAEGNNKDVVFADINLSEAPIRGEPHNPGMYKRKQKSSSCRCPLLICSVLQVVVGGQPFGISTRRQG
jgi:hypothetical protein